MSKILTSWEIIAHFDVISVTGDIRLDLMLVCFNVWQVIRTKP